MLRCIVGVICGAVAGAVFNMAVIMLSWMMYPLPEGTSMSDPEAMKTYIQSLPAAAFLIILVAHAGGALVGGFVAALIARRSALVVGAIVGGVFLLGGVMNAMSIPAPVWFVIVDLISYVPSGVIGAKMAPRPASTGTI